MISSTLFCDNCGGANQARAAYCRFCGQALHTGKPVIYHSATGLLLAGVLLKQRYRILASLGKGGMGAVYQAEDTQLGDRQIAVKEMSQSGLNSQERREAADAFRHEAVMLARLHHPNLPSIFDHFEENGHWYLVMSFIEGETLEDYLHHTPGGKLPVGEVIQIGLSLCTVLGYLHNQYPAIIFRDLKLANIMRTVDENLYLIDFGIARHFKPGQTKDTAYYGSMGYAPPEQYGKTQTTPRSDIYSLGAILHQLLSGHDPSFTPFRFPTLSALVSPLPAGLAMLVARMLDIDEEKRPESVLQVKQELQMLLAPGRSTLSTRPAMQTPISSSPARVPSVPLTPTKEQWVETGDTHSKARRYLEALNAYEQAIRLDPGFAAAYRQKSLALYGLGRYEQALATCEQALRCDPQDIDVYYCKADALDSLGDNEEAIHVYEQVMLLDPNNVRGYYGKATLLEALDRREEALPLLEQAIHLAPDDVRGYYGKADILEALEQREEALVVLEQAIHLAPDDVHGYRTKAILLETLDRNEEALGAREQVIRLEPDDAYNYYFKGSLLEKLNRLAEALLAYEEALHLDPQDDFMYLRTGALLNKLNLYGEALIAYEQAIRLKPDSADAYRGKGDTLQHLGRSVEALLAYGKASQCG